MKIMKKLAMLSLLVSAVFLLVSCGGDGGGGAPSTSVTKTATLTIAAEVPAPTAPSPANVINGTTSITVDTVTGAVTGTLTITGDSGRVTAAHIHDGTAGVSGPVVIGLQNNGNGIWAVPAGSVLDATQLAKFLANGYYVNAHTLLNGAGEIRGQLN